MSSPNVTDVCCSARGAVSDVLDVAVARLSRWTLRPGEDAVWADVLAILAGYGFHIGHHVPRADRETGDVVCSMCGTLRAL